MVVFTLLTRKAAQGIMRGARAKQALIILTLKTPTFLNADGGWYNGADYFDINAYSHVEQAIENEYDGIIVNHKNGNLYLAFEPNQIKLTTNENPTGGGHSVYSLKDGKGDYDYSKGEIAKYIANRSKEKGIFPHGCGTNREHSSATSFPSAINMAKSGKNKGTGR